MAVSIIHLYFDSVIFVSSSERFEMSLTSSEEGRVERLASSDLLNLSASTTSRT